MTTQAVRSEMSSTELLVLQEAAKRVCQFDSPAPAIQGILRLLSQLLGLNRGRVLLPDPGGRSLSIRYAYGLTATEIERGVYRHGEGVTGQVLRSGRLALIQDIDNEPNYLMRAVSRKTLPQETVAYIALPIYREQVPVGVLAVHRLRYRERAFHADVNLLTVIATFISQVLRIDDLVNEKTAMLQAENRYLRNVIDGEGARYGLLGASPSLKHALRQVLQVASTQTTVLLQGESGTGKERIARMLHAASTRQEGELITINCAAIPENLLESELFGHEKGSFTGATQTKRGKVELASGGTLFLDEIGDLALDLQGKLLRVLEERCMQRVGGTREIAVDVRIVAATHKNLQALVNEGCFRLDLFYRLNVFPIQAPPLRERPGDVAILTKHFLHASIGEFNRQTVLDHGVLERLEAYSWPGNIRQLENVVKRAVLTAENGRITVAIISQILQHESPVQGAVEPLASAGEKTSAWDRPPRPYERVANADPGELLATLRRCGGNKTRAALALGLTPRQLRYRLEKLGLTTSS